MDVMALMTHEGVRKRSNEIENMPFPLLFLPKCWIHRRGVWRSNLPSLIKWQSGMR